MNLTDEAKNIASKATSKLVQEAIHERDKTFSRTGDKIDKKDDPISSLVRAAAAGIGFVSEAVHYRQEKKSRSHQSQDTVPLAPKQLNEAIWARDDQNTSAAPEPLHPESTPQPPPKEEEPHDLAQAFLARHPPPPTTPTPPSPPNLPHPIILVQRRPQTRARGFIRAYPPCLASAGISQPTFLDFIDTFNKALEPNPYLYAINLAGLAGVAAQEPGLMLLGVGVAIATEAVMEGQSRWRGNGFLEVVNEGFWGPRGLGCWVVTWREGGGGGVVEGVGFDGVAVAGERDGGEERDFVRRVQDRVEGQVRRATKYSSGAVNWSEAAPLIFLPPDETPGPGKKKNAADRAEQWLDEFMDKRAQAKWVDKNANSPVGSTVALPKRAFRSRYADPNHPAASGDIVALLTGGQWQYGHAKAFKEKAAGEPKRGGNDESLDSREAKGTGSNKTKEKQTGGLMSLLQKDVLYLVIANLPSQVVELP